MFNRQPVSRHLLYLQLRQDILRERLACNEDQAVLLAALSLSAEYGDQTDLVREAVIDCYISPSILRQLRRRRAEELVWNRFIQLGRISEIEAKLQFLKVSYEVGFYSQFFLYLCFLPTFSLAIFLL